MSGLLIFVSGPSGAGKSTLCREIAGKLPAEFALSATTRAGKPQDAFGKRYEFLDEARFRQLVEAGEFLEYAQVFGNWYGTLRKPVCDALEEGRTVLLEIDVQGGQQIRRMFPSAVGIFVLPPGDEVLAQRLRGRGRDDEATIARRLSEAQHEIRTAQSCGAYDLMVINGQVSQAVEEMIRFIDTIRRSRSHDRSAEK